MRKSLGITLSMPQTLDDVDTCILLDCVTAYFMFAAVVYLSFTSVSVYCIAYLS